VNSNVARQSQIHVISTQCLFLAFGFYFLIFACKMRI